jgi:hypothetical protein
MRQLSKNEQTEVGFDKRISSNTSVLSAMFLDGARPEDTGVESVHSSTYQFPNAQKSGPRDGSELWVTLRSH